MNSKQIESIERYINTPDPYLNELNFEILCEVLKRELFEDPAIALRLFTDVAHDLPEQHKIPVKAFLTFMKKVEIEKLNDLQKEFICKWIYKYLAESEFDNDLTQVTELFKQEIHKLKLKNQPVQPLIKDIRGRLKEMVEKEVSKIEQYLNELDTLQRMTILCRLIPFILPKVDSIHHESGEE